VDFSFVHKVLINLYHDDCSRPHGGQTMQFFPFLASMTSAFPPP